MGKRREEAIDIEREVRGEMVIDRYSGRSVDGLDWRLPRGESINR